MDAHEALALLAPRLARWQGAVRAEVDEEGNLLLFVRRDLLHLEADALHDRLHHWTLRELRRALPAASAYVSFRHAKPADPWAEAELDLQEAWSGLEPTLRLEMQPPPARAEVEAFAALVPRFLERVDAQGRPAGFRQWDVGAQE